jgi:hypothetical protein
VLAGIYKRRAGKEQLLSLLTFNCTTELLWESRIQRFLSLEAVNKEKEHEGTSQNAEQSFEHWTLLVCFMGHD